MPTDRSYLDDIITRRNCLDVKWSATLLQITDKLGMKVCYEDLPLTDEQKSILSQHEYYFNREGKLVVNKIQ